MKAALISALSLTIAALCSGPAPVSKTEQQGGRIAGQYVEVRTASVFTGACHYNGELVTTGQQAVLAWHFTSGAFQGVDLSGVRAMAAVSSDANLGQQGARKTELVIDTAASDAQAKAVAALLREKSSATLGDIVTKRRAPVTFTRDDKNQYAAASEGFATMTVQPMPNGECCKQPNLVWYSPLTPIETRKVGFTKTASYTAATQGDAWTREGENSAFYGAFAY